MNRNFSKLDAIIIIISILFLFINIGALSAGARVRAKKEVCLTNMKTLTAGWQAYAEDNSGKLVNGAPYFPGGTPQTNCPAPPPGLDNRTTAIVPTPSSIFYSMHKDELTWVGPSWAFDYSGSWLVDIQQNACLQENAIRTGALWKYVQNLDIYRCPDGNRGQLEAYSIIDSMNGKYKYNGNCSMSENPVSFMFKNISSVGNPERRIVFMEEWGPSPDSYGVFYGCEKWFDLPCVRHINGTNVSFADGHSEFWKWKSQRTIDIGKTGAYMVKPPITDAAALRDLYRVQIGCWGKLGYTPSVPVE